MAYRRRVCYLCGKGYKFCPTCAEDLNKPAFLSTFHDENCATIFDTCVKYNMQLITKDEAKAALMNCDLSNKATFREDVQHDLEVILADPKRPAETSKQDVKFAKHEVVTKNV